MASQIDNRVQGPIPKPRPRKKREKVILDRTEGQRQPRQEDARYLACIRQLPCLISFQEGHIEAAHVRMSSNIHGKRQAGLAEKPDDKWVVPLTPAWHRKQHARNERRFWLDQGIDVIATCERLYEVRYDIDAMRAVIFEMGGAQ